MTTNQWNSRYAVGQSVRVRRDDGSYVDGATTSEAYTSASGHDVIHLDCVRGFYLLARVTAIPSPGAVNLRMCGFDNPAIGGMPDLDW
jgi:hypothetical protein